MEGKKAFPPPVKNNNIREQTPRYYQPQLPAGTIINIAESRHRLERGCRYPTLDQVIQPLVVVAGHIIALVTMTGPTDTAGAVVIGGVVTRIAERRTK